MPIPIAIPIVPLLKLVALGSMKTILLGVGACFFPRVTLRLIVGSASSLIIPVLHWLSANGKLEVERLEALTAGLNEIGNYDYTAKEARTILFKLTKKSLLNVRDAIISLSISTVELVRRGLNRVSGIISGRAS